jgi:hypothetical protein
MTKINKIKMTKKHYFVLRNIDPTEIDAKYSFYVPSANVNVNIVSNSGGGNSSGIPCMSTLMEEDPGRLTRTKITDLSYKHKEQHTFSYLDESKKEHTCTVTMIHHTEGAVPEKTTIHCFWCRHGFENRPLGCPIQYIPERIVKSYYSEITKDNYTLRENVSQKQLVENMEAYKKNKMVIQERDFYITDGVFCSFNCCLAFILDNHTNPLYTVSENLLTHLYMTVFGNKALPIEAASSWRLLRTYGGSLSIEEFRKNFYNVDYRDIDNVVIPFSKARSIGFLFEKQVRI